MRIRLVLRGRGTRLLAILGGLIIIEGCMLIALLGPRQRSHAPSDATQVLFDQERVRSPIGL